jgi:hypothetical protein
MASGRTVARVRRALVACAVVLMAAAATTGAGATTGVGASAAAPGQAEPEPLSITVSPATGIQPGQQVQVTIDGAPDASVVVAQCATSWGGPDNCQLPGVSVGPGERPSTVSLTISDFMNGIVGGSWWYCGDCYITAMTLDTSPARLGQVPIHVEPGELALRFLVDSDLAHEGGHAPTDLQEGDVLNTAVTGTRDVDTALALCDASVADTHDVAGGPCTPPAPVAAGSDACASRCRRRSPATTANEVHCRRDDCVVALASADEAVYLSLPVEFRFAGELTADPSAGLVDGQLVS